MSNFGIGVRYVLEADYEKVVKEIENYLKSKNIRYSVKKYSKPKMVKFKLGFMKSVLVMKTKNSVYVKVPSSEFCDVLAKFKAKAVVGKILDLEGMEIEIEILKAQKEAAKKTLILIIALTVLSTPAMVIKKMPPYNLLLLLFSLLPVRVEVLNIDVSAYPALYPYYAYREKKLKKLKKLKEFEELF